MKRYINIALSILAGIALSACLDDIAGPQTDVAPDGYMTIEFKAQVPQMSEVQT